MIDKTKLDSKIGFRISDWPYILLDDEHVRDLSNLSKVSKTLRRLYICKNNLSLQKLRKVYLSSDFFNDYPVYSIFNSEITKTEVEKIVENVFLLIPFSIELMNYLKKNDLLTMNYQRLEKYETILKSESETVFFSFFPNVESKEISNIPNLIDKSINLERDLHLGKLTIPDTAIIYSDKSKKIDEYEKSLKKSELLSCSIKTINQFIWFLHLADQNPSMFLIISKQVKNFDNYFDSMRSKVELDWKFSDKYALFDTLEGNLSNFYKLELIDKDQLLFEKLMLDPEINFISHIITLKIVNSVDYPDQFSVLVMFNKKNRTCEIYYPNEGISFHKVLERVIRDEFTVYFSIPQKVYRWKYFTLDYNDSYLHKVKYFGKKVTTEIDRFYLIIWLINCRISNVKKNNILENSDPTDFFEIFFDNESKMDLDYLIRESNFFLDVYKKRIDHEIYNLVENNETGKQVSFNSYKKLVVRLMYDRLVKNEKYTREEINNSVFNYAKINDKNELVEVGKPLCYFLCVENVVYKKLFGKRGSNLVFPYGLPIELIGESESGIESYIDQLRKILKKQEIMNSIQKTTSGFANMTYYLTIPVIAFMAFTEIIFLGVSSYLAIVGEYTDVIFTESAKFQYEMNSPENLTEAERNFIEHFLGKDVAMLGVTDTYTSNLTENLPRRILNIFISSNEEFFRCFEVFFTEKNIQNIIMTNFGEDTYEKLENVYNNFKSFFSTAFWSDVFKAFLISFKNLWSLEFNIIGSFSTHPSETVVVTFLYGIISKILMLIKYFRKKKVILEKRVTVEDVDKILREIDDKKEIQEMDLDKKIIQVIYTFYKSRVIIPEPKIEEFIEKVRETGKEYLCSNFYNSNFMQVRI